MSNAIGTLGTIIGGLFIATILITLLPFVMLWAMNLLGLTVAYTFKTWFGMLLVLFILRGVN